MTSTPTQDARPMTLTTPLAQNQLVFLRMTGHEAVGEMFEFRIEALTESDPPEEDDLIGHACTLSIAGEEEERHFNGICTDLRWIGSSALQHRYELTLRPALWLLTLQSDSRFFMDKKVDDILREVLEGAGVTDLRFEIETSRDPIHYCVQYQETTFAFVCRLMEKYGLYYFFEHEADKHTMVITDNRFANKEAPGYAEVPFEPQGSAAADRDHLFTLTQTGRIVTDEVVVNDYNYERASGQLESSQADKGAHGNTGNAIYNFRAGYANRADGDALAKVLLEASKSNARRINATGNTVGLYPGCKFKIIDDPLPGGGKDLLVVSARHTVLAPEYRTSNDLLNEEPYTAAYEFMPWLTPFRMPAKTPWPQVIGPHTAKVVGAPGEEIDVDDQGRIMVAFHWDRSGAKSCRVRVAQQLAGNKFGSTNIPRIGHEVIVSFLDGDPDKPLVTGTVYNSDNKPPIDMPANKTQMGYRSNSSKGGGGANEIVMEDKKDAEQFNITAERDFNLNVKNDAMIDVGYDKNDQGNLDLNVYMHRVDTISNGDFNIGVDTGNRTAYIKTDDTVEVDGNRTEKIAKTLGSEAKDITMKGSATVKAEAPTLEINGTTKTKVGSKMIEIDGMTIKISASAKLDIACGASSVSLTPAGVTISGPLVKIN